MPALGEQWRDTEVPVSPMQSPSSTHSRTSEYSSLHKSPVMASGEVGEQPPPPYEDEEKGVMAK
jgi:hypothetical protein